VVLLFSFIPEGVASLLRYLNLGIPDDGLSAK
jgi:hypothetical protein